MVCNNGGKPVIARYDQLDIRFCSCFPVFFMQNLAPGLIAMQDFTLYLFLKQEAKQRFQEGKNTCNHPVGQRFPSHRSPHPVQILFQTVEGNQIEKFLVHDICNRGRGRHAVADKGAWHLRFHATENLVLILASVTDQGLIIVLYTFDLHRLDLEFLPDHFFAEYLYLGPAVFAAPLPIRHADGYFFCLNTVKQVLPAGPAFLFFLPGRFLRGKDFLLHRSGCFPAKDVQLTAYWKLFTGTSIQLLREVGDRLREVCKQRAVPGSVRSAVGRAQKALPGKQLRLSAALRPVSCFEFLR